VESALGFKDDPELCRRRGGRELVTREVSECHEIPEIVGRESALRCCEKRDL